VKTSHLLLALTASAALTGSTLVAGPLKLKVDPAASSVTFDVRVNVGAGSFTGTVENWTLELVMPENGDLPERAVFAAEVTALKTGKDKRDQHLREWLESASNPTVRYEMKAIRRTEAGVEAEGELTIHGKTQPLTMPVSLEREGEKLTVKGEVTIDTRKFDLEIIRLAGVITVKPEVKIAFVATGTLE
jgi:polyisoprenoid-binding protein YceI